MIKLSVVIPSYKDPLLNKTIADLLRNSELGDQLEIIAVFDGYWGTPIQDKRVRYIHLGRNRGMRGAINAGVSVSRGEFFMRLDEHCAFGKGYDRIMTESCEQNQIMTAKRFFLDPVKWEIMDIQPVEHEKLTIQEMGNGVRKFSGARWRSRDKEQKDVMLSETLAMQGSMWIMPRAWWDKHIGELQSDGYGVAYQDSVEVCMKTWKNGGKLILNKNTWYAHKHRSFSRTHQEGTKENPWRREKSWEYALSQWETYYRQVIMPKWKL
jgi:GT2 family glycosyltransferase